MGLGSRLGLGSEGLVHIPGGYDTMKLPFTILVVSHETTAESLLHRSNNFNQAVKTQLETGVIYSRLLTRCCRPTLQYLILEK